MTKAGCCGLSSIGKMEKLEEFSSVGTLHVEFQEISGKDRHSLFFFPFVFFFFFETGFFVVVQPLGVLDLTL